MECRFCFEDDEKDSMISPCKCDGTSKYVHKSCLSKWILYKKSNICPVCNQEYEFQPDIKPAPIKNQIIQYILEHDFCTTLITGFIIISVILTTLYLKIALQNLVSSIYCTIFGMIFIQWYFNDQYINFDQFLNIMLVSQNINRNVGMSVNGYGFGVLVQYLWSIIDEYKYQLLIPCMKV